jgi:hypothetical protein
MRGNRGVAGSVIKLVMEKLGDQGRGVDKKELGKLVTEALKGSS